MAYRHREAYRASQREMGPVGVTTANPQDIRVASGHGRLYVLGPGAPAVAARVAAAGGPPLVYNPRRHGYEASLTLATLRALRTASCGEDRRAFSRLCEADVLRWAQAATTSEARVTDMHARLEAGYRARLPWQDYTWQEQGFAAPRVPFAHQQVMATAALELDGVAFICDVGTGKTRAAVEAMAAQVRAAQVEVAVVVCPKKVIRTWCREMDSWARGTLRAVPVGRTPRAREAQVRALRHGDVLVCNYDVLGKVLDDIKLLVPSQRKLGFVVDEMQRLKNPHAKRTKAAMEMARRAVWRVGQSGSPILQGVQDIWSQWYVIDYGVTFGANFPTFRHEYTTQNPWTMEIEPRPGALERAGELMRRRGLRYRKEDCLDLPPRTWEVEEVEMGTEQAAAYRQMQETLVAVLRGGAEAGERAVATAANQLTVGMRLTQVTSGWLPDEDGVIHRFATNPKLDELEALVEENIGNEQIIVWAWYREDVRAICERLARYQPVTLVGGQSEREATAAEEAFASGARRLLVANPAAGGAGLNLQAASLAIYYSQWYALEHRLQSEGRNHRSGSERHARVTYIDLVCRGTVDEIVCRALQRKQDVAEVVTDLRRHLGLLEEA